MFALRRRTVESFRSHVSSLRVPLAALTAAVALTACGERATSSSFITAPPANFDRGSDGPHTRRVAISGTDVGDCTSSPCRTINYAIGQAAVGDEVSVAAGTYFESVKITKRLLVTGHGATIDAAAQSAPPNAVVIAGAGAAGTRLSGFTVQHAGLEGIFVDKTSNIVIDNNVAVGNDAYGPNHPLCFAQPDDCGEAIHLQSVTNSIVRGNVVHDNVGGILLTDEEGPTSGNLITGNQVLNNTKDCGITLASHWFDPSAAAAASVAGVYRNLVLNNVSNRNGAAGIGVFAGPPGAAAWENTVIGNTAMHNGEGGLMMHSHAPAQNIENNTFIANTLAGNGVDPDNPADDLPTDISFMSAVLPVAHVIVAANRLSDDHYGIVSYHIVKLDGLASNQYSSTIAVPTSIH